MGSFKVKLVAYFLLLSLLPLAAAFWGFSTVAARSEAQVGIALGLVLGSLAMVFLVKKPQVASFVGPVLAGAMIALLDGGESAFRLE